MKMRLGFHYHAPARPCSGGAFATNGPQGRFLESIAPYCEEVLCFLHSAVEGDVTEYVVRAPNIRWIDIGPHSSVPRRMLSARRSVDAVRAYRNSLDAMLVRGPSPLLPAVARAVDVPVILLLVGDQLAGIADVRGPVWRRELIRLFWLWNRHETLAVARNALVLANSPELCRTLSGCGIPVRFAGTSNISASEFYFREDTCFQAPFRLLYAGRISREKGLLDIVEAVRRLVAEGWDVVLDLVGPQIPGDAVAEDVLSLAKSTGIGSRVLYHGSKPPGPELFAFYKRADVLVLASSSSFEGFPRAVWEAMAHGLPVVATRVGGIPKVLTHLETAILVEPKCPQSLANGITLVLREGELRRRLIQSGYKLAKENTLERRAEELISMVESFVGERRSVKRA